MERTNANAPPALSISLGPRFNGATWVKRPQDNADVDTSTDLCTVSVSTEWFRLVTAAAKGNAGAGKKAKAADECELPVTVLGGTGRIVPVIGYVGATSLVCDCACQRRVAAARAAFGSTASDEEGGGSERANDRVFEHDIDPRRAVYHTATRDAFCAALPQGAVSSTLVSSVYLGHSRVPRVCGHMGARVDTRECWRLPPVINP